VGMLLFLSMLVSRRLAIAISTTHLNAENMGYARRYPEVFSKSRVVGN